MKRLIIPALIAMTLPACSTSTYIERDHKLIHIQDTQVQDTQVYDTQVHDTQVYDTQVYDRSRSNTNTTNTVIRHERPRRPAQQDIVNDID